MADVGSLARLRAERRRRKILENSEDRLRKITGGYAPITANGDNNKADGISNVNKTLDLSSEYPEWMVPDGEVCDLDDSAVASLLGQQPCTMRDSRHFAFPKILEEHRAVPRSRLIAAGDNTSLGGSPGADGARSTSAGLAFVQGWAGRAVEWRIPLIFLAVITRLLLTSQLSFFVAGNAIVPFLLAEVAIFVSEKSYLGNGCQASNRGGGDSGAKMGEGGIGSGLLGAALMLSGLPPERVVAIVKTAHLARRVAHDLAVYLFSFAAFHVLVS